MRISRLVTLVTFVTLGIVWGENCPTLFGNKHKDEYVILSGGCANQDLEAWRAKRDQHDRWWGNYIRTARMRMQELRKIDYDLEISWLVYKPSYERRARQERKPLLDFIRSVRDKYKTNLVWVYSGADVIDYLNRGKNRKKSKLLGFEYFGHSNKFCFMLDYSGSVIAASKAWLHERDLRHLKKGIFARNAYVKSWGCHSGESYVKKWRLAVGVPMIGAIGKTDYSYSYINLPLLSSPNGSWTR